MSSDQLAMRSGERLPQSYVGLLTDAQGNGKLLVSSLRHGKTMTVKVIGPITPPASGRLVLWAVPASGPGVLAGYALPTSGSAVSMLPDTSEKLLSKVGKLVVTLETDAHPGQTRRDRGVQRQLRQAVVSLRGLFLSVCTHLHGARSVTIFPGGPAAGLPGRCARRCLPGSAR
jgi:hypothetical protein